MTTKRIIAYSPTPKLGLGFPERSLNAALKKGLDYICGDCGGTDSGPYDLGSGENTTHAAEGIRRDLETLLKVSIDQKIPLLIGTAGHAGGDPHLQSTRVAIEQILASNNLHATVAYIHSEQRKEFLKSKLSQGKIKPLNPWGFSKVYPIDNQIIDASNRIVGVMGIEPYMDALKQGADVVVAGRSSDPAIVASGPIGRGFAPGPVWHAAQIICDGTTDGPDRQPDGMIATIYDGSFVVEPADEKMKLPISQLVSLAMHETGSPYIMHLPGGILHTKDCKYEQLTEREVRVTGSRFEPTPYTVKLEGTRMEGYRTVFFGGVRDPQIISQVDVWLASFKALLEENLRSLYGRPLRPEEFAIYFRVYGKNAVMGSLEPIKDTKAHEILVLVEIVASSEEISYDIGMRARQLLSHFDPPSGSKSGNPIAIPFSPQPLRAGSVYRWTMNHVVEIEDHKELQQMFPMELVKY